MKNRKIIIGSRRSKLAMIYAEKAREKILSYVKNFGIDEVAIKEIETKGDQVLDQRLSEVGGKGLFSKNIEVELLDNKIDIAVHALKDMPSEETEGLLTSCFLERNDPRETLISKNHKQLKDLSPNSIIGTSSFRREFQIKKMRDDLDCKLIRGNVDTRIKKLNENFYDGIILSYAGINSLGLNQNISQIFSTSEIIPCAGQGVIALQCRDNDKELIEILKSVNHQLTHNCIKAERNVLKILEGDCETAVGVFASISGFKINLEAELFSLDGSKRFHLKLSENINKANELGIEVGKALKKLSNNSHKK
ncbi:hydroxymethylbilane synthase [Candidatus Pelagibacter ubique]|uniref:Porphobilinogen deaminase n=1 Tax=Pelagibacter ubique TaxID=198252 RepID=A0ABX1T1I0_PELUQ|nr:hydroxymethylbilane synthase [Candidatus Pelagibacter ubique]NMN67324.1 hydroxymethylbilane synthase [Candidatus Pelagibacter ubique]